MIVFMSDVGVGAGNRAVGVLGAVSVAEGAGVAVGADDASESWERFRQ